MSDTLKPCPFCGGEADIRQVDNGKWHISTLRCGNGDTSHHAHVIADTKAEAIAAWNTRAADKPGTLLRETALDYTERLGEAAKTLHIETRCTYDDLRVLCKTLMGVGE